MKTIGLYVLGALLATVSAVGQQGGNQEDKRPRIDVDNYTIDVQIKPRHPDADSARRPFASCLSTTRSRSVTFELNNALAISRIVDDHGQTLQSSRNQSDNTVRVTLPNRLPKGQPAVLTFNYDGHLTGSEESPIYGIKFAAIQNDYAFLLYPARWFPVSGYTSDRFTSKINVTAPPDFTVVGGGDFNKPAFPGDIAIFKGQPVKNATEGLTTALWFRGAEANMANAYGTATAQMVEYFTSIFGLAPLANLTVMETDDGFPNGYAGTGMVFISPAAVGKEVNGNVLANQVARQWWEVQVSPVNRNHMWMENGMALYSGSALDRARKGHQRHRTKDEGSERDGIDGRQRAVDSNREARRLFARILGSQRGQGGHSAPDAAQHHG